MSKCSVVIIDYDMGNIRSILKKVQRLGFEVSLTYDGKTINNAGKLILPGVGHFGTGMNKLKERNLIELLEKKVLRDKIPILGICLGMQLLSNSSEEGNSRGLGWIDAQTSRFNITGIRHKVPHMGWNSLDRKKESPILSSVPIDSYFYFAHSYHIVCNDKNDILTTTRYGYEFVSAVQRDNIFGTQFHPEKSHVWGEKILENFLNL